MIAFNLACYASVTGRMEDPKERLRNAIELDKAIRGLAIDDDDLKPIWDWIAEGQDSGCWFEAMHRELTTAIQSVLGAPFSIP
jgi:hypothetical protein